MDDLEHYQALKKAAEDRQREHDRARGAWESIQTRLEKEFGVKTLDQAVKLLSSTKKERMSKQEQFKKALQQFEDDFGEVLGE